MLTKSQENKLRQMLGADERYKKKQWGFRNHFCASVNSTDDFQLRDMQSMGLVKSGRKERNMIFYHATKEGAVAICFKAYQLRKTKLA